MAVQNPNSSQKHLAVLIDADNAPAAIVEGLFEEIAKYGVASVKRIYGDWTGPQLGGWKKVLLDYSIQPIQQFAYTKGKNATDSSLIIDYKGFPIEHKPNSFCLTPLHMPDRRKKVKDCGTTNGHLELIARTLMKDAREGLVR